MPERWPEPEDESGNDRHPRGECERRGIDGDLIEPREADTGSSQVASVQGRRQEAKNRDPAKRHRRSRGTPDERKQHAFRQQLANQPAGARADGAAHGNLVLARGEPRHQKIRDVDARDEEHEPDGNHEDEQRRPDGGYDFVLDAGQLVSLRLALIQHSVHVVFGRLA
jgi:hypothetical protein